MWNPALAKSALKTNFVIDEIYLYTFFMHFNFLVIKLTYSSDDIDRTPKTLYIWCAFSYVGAMLASNAALQYVSYPTQVKQLLHLIIDNNISSLV